MRIEPGDVDRGEDAEHAGLALERRVLRQRELLKDVVHRRVLQVGAQHFAGSTPHQQ
jgi:hypothetical protein